MRIKYNTARNCDFGDRDIEESLTDFVDRDGRLGRLVELLVDKGVISVQDVFEKFKTWDDHNLVE